MDAKNFSREGNGAAIVHNIEALMSEWTTADDWITRDDYQSGGHTQKAKNKRRNTWFTLVFHAVDEVVQSGFLNQQVQTSLLQSKQELRSRFQEVQSAGQKAYIEAAVPLVQAFFKDIGISTGATGFEALVAIQLMKDPSGELAARTLVEQIGEKEITEKFDIAVEIEDRFGIERKTSPQLKQKLANFVKDSNIDRLKELMGNPDSLVAAADALLLQTKQSLDQSIGYEARTQETPSGV